MDNTQSNKATEKDNDQLMNMYPLKCWVASDWIKAKMKQRSLEKKYAHGRIWQMHISRQCSILWGNAAETYQVCIWFLKVNQYTNWTSESKWLSFGSTSENLRHYWHHFVCYQWHRGWSTGKVQKDTKKIGKRQVKTSREGNRRTS